MRPLVRCQAAKEAHRIAKLLISMPAFLGTRLATMFWLNILIFLELLTVAKPVIVSHCSCLQIFKGPVALQK